MEARLKRLNILALGVLASASASAATLKPDAILCESAALISSVQREEFWRGKGGQETMRQARLSAESQRLTEKFAGVQRRLSADEERIRADSNLRIASGSTSARAIDAESAAQRAGRDAAGYESIVSGCADSGAIALQAEVLEQRPISGASRIRIEFRGAPAELWTPSADLTK